MEKHKNLIMMVVAIILLAYVCLLTLYPYCLTKFFNRAKFEESAYNATGLITSVELVEYKMKPSLTMVITLRNWSSKYVDYQDCFSADMIELQTGPFSVLTKDFPIKDMFLRHVKFDNQMLPDGTNKLAYLPKSFEVSAFGAKKITIKAGPVRVQDFKIKNIAPGFYKEDNRPAEKYSRVQVKDFLDKAEIRNIVVK